MTDNEPAAFVDSVPALQGCRLTAGAWSTNCGSEIFATVDGQEVRIGHFLGCANDSAAICILRNGAFFSADAKEALAKATPGIWAATEDSDIVAVVDGEEVRIGFFNGCVEDATAVCVLHNRAEEIMAAVAHLCA